MAEYIEREALIDEINKLHVSHGLADNEQMMFDETDICGLVLCQKTADVEPVRHGRWIGSEKTKHKPYRMTAKDAIRNIEIAIAEVEWEYPMNYAVAFEVAIEALEKQISKKPKLIKEDYTMDRILMRDFECPSCGNPRADDSYCQTCGQRLDWSDTNG